jgi:hypothetical protein
MHIEHNRINQPLTEQESAHLQQCEQCRQLQQTLAQLHQDAQALVLMTPPPQSWQKIKSTMQDKPAQPKFEKPSPWQNITAIAATLMLTAFGYLMWSNYQLQGQLKQVLQVNQALELQLDQNNMPGFRQAQLLLQVKGLEQALDQAQNPSDKLRLLQQRQQLIADMIEAQKGEQHEFSI